MSYFGESTLEHKVQKYMEGIKNANNLKDYESSEVYCYNLLIFKDF